MNEVFRFINGQWVAGVVLKPKRAPQRQETVRPRPSKPKHGTKIPKKVRLKNENK